MTIISSLSSYRSSLDYDEKIKSDEQDKNNFFPSYSRNEQNNPESPEAVTGITASGSNDKPGHDAIRDTNPNIHENADRCIQEVISGFARTAMKGVIVGIFSIIIQLAKIIGSNNFQSNTLFHYYLVQYLRRYYGYYGIIGDF